MYKIYWTDNNNNIQGQEFTLLTVALQNVEILRRSGLNRYVTMVSENPNHVGKPGVDSVVEGKTPQGLDYDWTKSDRAGKPRKSDKIISSSDH